MKPWLPSFTFFLLVHFTPASSKSIELTILNTTDIHAEFAWDNTINPEGDWLRLATLIRRERERAGGEKHCLLIDCGDSIQGSLIGQLSSGEVGIIMLNKLNYDAWIPGNHELDFGVDRLRDLLETCRIPIINGNFSLINAPSFPAYRIYEKSGVKIAVIGMNSSFLQNWLWGSNMKGYEITMAMPLIETLLPEIMAHRPALIIAALHQGFMENDKRNVNEIMDIARRFPQIDLILGGHTHRLFVGKKIAHSWYVQAGCKGRYLARITVEIEPIKQQVLGIASQMIDIAGEEQDAVCHDAVLGWLQSADHFAKKKIVHVNKAVSSAGIPGSDCPMSEIICRAIAWKTNVDVVFHGILSDHSWPGNQWLDEAGLFATIPYENTIGIAELTPAEIITIFNEQQAYRHTNSFNGIWGVHPVCDSATGTITSLNSSDGTIWKTGSRLRVAFNSHTIAGGGGRFPVLKQLLNQPEVRLIDTSLNSRDLVREFLQCGADWQKSPVRWVDPFICPQLRH